eukprot:gene13803-29349_t
MEMECEVSFTALKKSLTTDCIRRYPDPKRPFELHTDALDCAIGAVLVQRSDEVKRFHVHLACAPFYVFTDHQALSSLLTMKDPTRRIARWLITLGEYPFIAVYRRGSLNGD